MIGHLVSVDVKHHVYLSAIRGWPAGGSKFFVLCCDRYVVVLWCSVVIVNKSCLS